MTGFFDGVLGCHVGKIVGNKVVVKTFGERKICIAFETDGNDLVDGVFLDHFSVEEPGTSYQGLSYEEAVKHVAKDLDKELKTPIPVYILPRSPGVTLEIEKGWEIFAESYNPNYVRVRKVGDRNGQVSNVEKEQVVLTMTPSVENQVDKQNRRQDIIMRTRENGYRTHDYLKKGSVEAVNAVLKEARA